MIRYIYSLSCPLTKEIRYIGQTRNLKARLYKHLSTSIKNPSNHTQCWINGLLKNGLKPVMEEVELCATTDVDSLEAFYISLFRQWGFDLTNLEGGGCKNKTVSKKTRELLALINTGKKQSEATKLKRKESVTKAWQDPFLKAAQSERTTNLNRLGIIGTKGKKSNKKGKPFSGDKAKLSQSLKRYYQNNTPVNKIVFDNVSEIIELYNNNSMSLIDIAKRFNASKGVITKLMKQNSVPFRNGRKAITKDQLIQYRVIRKLSVSQIAVELNCSIPTVEKYIKRYGIYRNKACIG